MWINVQLNSSVHSVSVSSGTSFRFMFIYKTMNENNASALTIVENQVCVVC